MTSLDMHPITAWLEQKSPSYQEGINLFKKYCKNAALLHLFNCGISDTNRALLREKLCEVTVPRPAIEKTKPDQLRCIMIEKFKRANHLHLTDLRSASLDKRKSAAKEILELFDDYILPIQRMLREFEKTGVLKENTYLDPPKEMNAFDLHQAICNLKAQISKQKNNAARADDVVEWQEKLKSYEHALQQK